MKPIEQSAALPAYLKLPEPGSWNPSLKNLKMSLQPTGTTQATVARGTKIRRYTKTKVLKWRRESSFDIKKFHSLVLGRGSVPLDVLENVLRDRYEGKNI